jgi:hypothetical protein
MPLIARGLSVFDADAVPGRNAARVILLADFVLSIDALADRYCSRLAQS